MFRGIPFAAAPLDDLRWRPPVRVARWQGVRDATRFGAACAQIVRGEAPVLADGTRMRISEDCLTLNVWAPAGVERRRLPVMVWIYGGGYTGGSGALPTYDGKAFARDGVILVSINYRVGAFGYFAHPAITASVPKDEPLSNYGTLDQIEALRWVKRNIAAFGGDPGNVTIFGQSAGAGSVLTLLTAPHEPLFQKAIHQSGDAWSGQHDLAQKEEMGEALVRDAGVTAAHPTVDALRALDMETLLKAQATYLATRYRPYHDGLMWVDPVIDGRLLKGDQADLIRHHLADVPLLVGWTNGEYQMQSDDRLRAFFASAPAASVARFRTAHPDLAGDELKLARTYFTDTVFGDPARWLAEAASGGAPAYLYQVSYVPSGLRDRWPAVPHAGELGTLFGTFPLAPTDRGDETVSETMRHYWISFARTGRPEGPVAWPAYRAAARRHMLFAATPSIVDEAGGIPARP